MRTPILLALITVVSLTMNDAAALAQSAMTSTMNDVKPDSASFFTAPTPVPDSPAFSILGVTPKNVTRPATPQELGLALLNGADAQGNLQSGLALDVSPFRLLANPTLSQYRDSLSNQFASRFAISAATSKGSSDSDKSVRAGLGFNWVPFDGGDPRLDYA